MNEVKRINRAQVQWYRFMKPIAFCILDTILFRTNPVPTNTDPWKQIYVRTLAKKLHVSVGQVSEELNKWPFIHSTGSRKATIKTFHYDEMVKWTDDEARKLEATELDIKKPNNRNRSEKRKKRFASTGNNQTTASFVHTMNNHCSYYEPISSNEVSTCTFTSASLDIKSGVSDPMGLLDGSDTKNFISYNNASMEQCSGVSVLPCASTSGNAQKDCPIVHTVNKKAPKVRLSGKNENILICKLPRNIKNIPSAIRQRHIVGKVNDWTSFNLRLTANGYKKDGFSSIAAIDEQDKCILITADNNEFLGNEKIQEMVLHFMEQDYNLFYWSGENQTASLIVKSKVNTSDEDTSTLSSPSQTIKIEL